MKIVQQRNATDCVIASMAMWLKKPYEHIMSRAIELEASPTSVGMYDEQEDRVLKSFGIFPARIGSYSGGVEGILSVPSLNNKYGSHAVYVKNNMIFDPRSGVEGKQSYPSDLRTFPSHINCVIDLNDDYSRSIFEWSLNREKKVLKDWQSKRDRPDEGETHDKQKT